MHQVIPTYCYTLGHYCHRNYNIRNDSYANGDTRPASRKNGNAGGNGNAGRNGHRSASGSGNRRRPRRSRRGTRSAVTKG